MTPEKRTLPARYYTDPDLFTRERERIFATMWVVCGADGGDRRPW